MSSRLSGLSSRLAYNGFEIDMLALGDADSILVTRWQDGVSTRVLIDGGKGGSYGVVRDFLTTREVKHLDHVVSTHFHEDHAGGLIPLVSKGTVAVGQVWMHLPSEHGDLAESKLLLHHLKGESSSAIRHLQESVNTRNALKKACDQRRIPVAEPFAGENVGFFTVCGPSKSYYEELVQNFGSSATLESIASTEQQDEAERSLQEASRRVGEDSLSQTQPSTPENDSSVILGTIYGNERFLFTGDAGPNALWRAAANFRLKHAIGCRFLTTEAIAMSQRRSSNIFALESHVYRLKAI